MSEIPVPENESKTEKSVPVMEKDGENSPPSKPVCSSTSIPETENGI